MQEFIDLCIENNLYRYALPEAVSYTHLVLRVGVNTQNQPLAGVSTSSQNIVGLDVDIAAYLADSFGLKLELVDVGTDAQAALDGGTVDIVMGVDKRCV